MSGTIKTVKIAKTLKRSLDEFLEIQPVDPPSSPSPPPPPSQPDQIEAKKGRLFQAYNQGPKKSKPKPKSNAAAPKTTFDPIDVILLPRMDCFVFKFAEQYSRYSAKGLVVNSPPIEKALTPRQMKEELRGMFSKYLKNIDFEVMKNAGSDIISLNLKKGQVADGDQLSKIFARRRMFLLPKKDLGVFDYEDGVIDDEDRDLEEDSDLLKVEIKEEDSDSDLQIVSVESVQAMKLTKISSARLPDSQERSKTASSIETVPNQEGFQSNALSDSEVRSEETANSMPELNDHTYNITDPSNFPLGDSEHSSNYGEYLDAMSKATGHNYFPDDAPKEMVELGNMLKELAASSVYKTAKNPMLVQRQSVFQSLKKNTSKSFFDPSEKLNIKFTDRLSRHIVVEAGVDRGGLTKEAFTLCFREMKDSKSMFEGPDDDKFLALHKSALEKRDYFHLGQFVSMSMVQGGPYPTFFSVDLLNLLLGDIYSLDLTTCYNSAVLEEISKIDGAQTVYDLINVVTGSSTYQLAGINYPIMNLDQKTVIKQDLIKFYKVQSLSPAIEQLQEGLQLYGMLNFMKINRTLMLKLVQYNSTLSAKTIFSLFFIERSLDKSNNYNMENTVLDYWWDFLLECENGVEGTVPLRKILMFALGVELIPPLGFPVKPKLCFIHDKEASSILPKANTCALILRLPVKHKTYEEFKYAMRYSSIEGMTFEED